MKLWNEIFAKFILDIAKIVFTTLVLGRIITPELVAWWMFIGGMILLVLFIIFSYLIMEIDNNAGD